MGMVLSESGSGVVEGVEYFEGRGPPKVEKVALFEGRAWSCGLWPSMAKFGKYIQTSNQTDI